jgi:Arc/MetJ family transcription regulator
MTKRLIEIDDEKLAAIRELLGTQTLRANVDGAFDEVLALDRRRRTLIAGQGVGTGDLDDPAARQSGWG